MRDTIDIPIIVTVISEYEDVRARIESGASILNVSAAKNTPALVKKIRSNFPDFPIIATGGPSDESILETIAAGANAITYTPPTAADVMNMLMNKYRDRYKDEYQE
jgi:dihydroorotate dehydrogenase